jgi:hypothetical protein
MTNAEKTYMELREKLLTGRAKNTFRGDPDRKQVAMTRP